MDKVQSFLEVDVREDIALKKEPFQKIMKVVESLQDNQGFILHAPFNPLPLYKVMKRKGFDHTAEHIDKKHWKITFSRKEGEV